MYLGIDVGGSKIQGAYFRSSSRRRAVALTSRLATPASYETFLAALERLGREAAQEGRALWRVCVGLPGTCSERRALWVPHLPYLNGRNLAEDLEGRLGVPVVLGNDAQLALLGEVWRGAARRRRSAALLSVGTGIGGALLLDGRIVRGVHGSAGAFGWLNFDYRCAPDPDHGFLEQMASGSALAGRAQQLEPPLTSYELIAQARAGHPACLNIVREVGHLLGLACASIASLFDPEVLLFTGGLSEAFDLFEPVMREQLQRYGAPGVRTIPLLRAQLGSEAAAYGALRAAERPRSL